MDAETLKHRGTVRAMNARGMSQRDIADAIGLSVATVNRLLRLDKEPEGENLVQQMERKMREHRERIARTELPPEDAMASFEW